jgi:hypothetical protein
VQFGERGNPFGNCNERAQNMKQNLTHIIRDAFLERVPIDGVKAETHDVKNTLIHKGLTDDILIHYMQQYPLLDIRFVNKYLFYTLRIMHKKQILWIEFCIVPDQQGFQFVVKAIRS